MLRHGRAAGVRMISGTALQYVLYVDTKQQTLGCGMITTATSCLQYYESIRTSTSYEVTDPVLLLQISHLVSFCSSIKLTIPPCQVRAGLAWVEKTSVTSYRTVPRTRYKTAPHIKIKTKYSYSTYVHCS